MMQPERKTLVRAEGGGRAVHDVGGLDFGPVDRHEHDLTLSEKRTDAMLMLLCSPRKGVFKIDAMRRVIEDYGQQAYDSTTYYQKWIRAVRNLLLEQEVLTEEEVKARVAEIREQMRKAGRQVSDVEVPIP